MATAYIKPLTISLCREPTRRFLVYMTELDWRFVQVFLVRLSIRQLQRGAKTLKSTRRNEMLKKCKQRFVDHVLFNMMRSHTSFWTLFLTLSTLIGYCPAIVLGINMVCSPKQEQLTSTGEVPLMNYRQQVSCWRRISDNLATQVKSLYLICNALETINAELGIHIVIINRL